MTEIEKLAEKVKALTGPMALPVFDAEWKAWVEACYEAFPAHPQGELIFQALQGDLNSAVAFVEAVLPGYRWTRDITGMIVVWMPETHPSDPRQTAWEGVGHSGAPTPSLALVLAALRALNSAAGEG